MRTYKGSTRPPDISPEQWISTAREQREAIASYQAELAAAEVAAAAPTAQVTNSGVPRLPRLAGVAEFEPHREKNAEELTTVYPCCVARKLSKKEMESCPRAKKALDAGWEKH